MDFFRRDILKLGLGAAAASALSPLVDLLAQGTLITRPIHSSGERLPIVGIGCRDYEAETPEIRAELKEVVRQFAERGGRVLDTASNYRAGASEALLGELTSELGNRDRLFLATKINVTGKEAGLAQIEQCFRRLRAGRIDLIAVHNIRDVETQLANLRQTRDAKRIRYIGITTSSDRQYAEFEEVMRREPLDFVQVDYALDQREAGERLIPLAADRGMAVMVNMPFGRGRLFSAVQAQRLPDWAAEIDCTTWAQIFLKYIVSHPAVTCVIPGTRRVRHIVDNLQAAQGKLPDAAMRRRMEEFMDAL